LRRPCFHALTGIGRERAEPRAVHKHPLEHGGKRINISTRKNISFTNPAFRVRIITIMDGDPS
jgi:hypothetical protein